MERSIYFYLIASLCLMAVSFSQTDAQTILQGQVTDEDQNPVPAAQVRIIRHPNGAIAYCFLIQWHTVEGVPLYSSSIHFTTN